MVQITVHERACRGCEMCVDVCPTRVLDYDKERHLAVVTHPEDCIACLSCSYICPSGAVRHEEYHVVKNFYRDLDFTRKMEKFL